MTQRISDKWLRTILAGGYVIDADKVVDDLLSLRAAVRRVLDAEDAYEEAMVDPVAVSDIHHKLDVMRAERRKLRAEMAGIDNTNNDKEAT